MPENDTFSVYVNNVSRAAMAETKRIMDAFNRLGCCSVNDYNNLLMNCVRKCEALTMYVRELPFTEERPCFSYMASFESPFSLSFLENDTIELKCLRILPHRKKDNRYYYGSMFSFLVGEVKGKEFKRLSSALITFIHVYPENEKAKRDYDNIETKAAIDIITAFFLNGDNPDIIDVYHTQRKGDKPCTIIRISPKPEIFL